MAVHGVATADEMAAPDKLMAFDLPAQPLASALETYSIVSGWQVIYNARLAVGRRSAGVEGEFTPDAALQRLLTGTGLAVRYKSDDGVVLIPDPKSADMPVETPDEVDPSFASYYGLIQTGLKRAFCASSQIRTGSYRLALGFWIGPSGAVSRTTLFGSTGRTDIDQSFDRAVRSLSVGEAPPPGFSQPVVLLVTPDLIGKCDPAKSGPQPVGAEQ